MAGIGSDIADVMNELGVEATILRTGSVEKITYDTHTSTVPFIREHFLNASLPYNTAMVPGELFSIMGQVYFLGSKVPDFFEGEVVEYNCSMYKCNLPATASLVYETEVKDSETFKITKGWATRKSPIYGLIFKDARKAINDSEVSFGKQPTYRLECIVPDSYGVEIADRLIVSPTEYYRVEDIEKHEYPGMWILELVDDGRKV